MRQEGKSYPEIEVVLGRGHNSLRHKYAKVKGNTASIQEPVPVGALESFENAALETEIAQLRAKLAGYDDAGNAANSLVTCAAPAEPSIAEEWKRVEEDSAKRIERSQKKGQFKAAFGDEPIALVAMSDQHIAPGTNIDFKRMREDAELIRDTPGFYAILGGDLVDNHLHHKSAMIAARSTPEDQWKLGEWYLSIFAEKILVVISGNHDDWTKQHAGVDVLSRIAKNKQICQCPHEARIDITVGGQLYKIALRHQYRFGSSFNQSHTIKRFYEMGDDTFDIGIIGHHHEHCLEQFVRHRLKRWACRPGSYQVSTSYSSQYGFSDAQATCPTFILSPGERRIIGFGDLRDAVSAWEGLRP